MFKWIINMKFFGKMLMWTAFLLVFMIGVGVYGIQAVKDVQENTKSLYTNQLIPVALLAGFEYNSTVNGASLRSHVESTDPAMM